MPEVELYAQTTLPLPAGQFNLRIYRSNADDKETVVISQGSLKKRPLFVRLHSECWTGEVLRSLRCDCDAQLQQALAQIAERGEGLIIYLRQEGRGIGLGNKIRAYQLQNQGMDTIHANEALGFPSDARDFSTAIAILNTLGITEVDLHTNNPAKSIALHNAGIKVATLIPSLTALNEYNEGYMRTKYTAMGHQLASLFPDLS